MSEPTPIISPWQLKPWWCQPWSIVLTGFAIIGGSWLMLHRVWVTSLVAIPIGAWMGFFLILWPRLMREAGYLDAAPTVEPPNQSVE